MPEQVFDQATQDEMMNRAKNDKMWDMCFLQSLMNAQNLNSKIMYTEYGKYLKDPYGYKYEG